MITTSRCVLPETPLNYYHYYGVGGEQPRRQWSEMSREPSHRLLQLSSTSVLTAGTCTISTAAAAAVLQQQTRPSTASSSTSEVRHNGGAAAGLGGHVQQQMMLASS